MTRFLLILAISCLSLSSAQAAIMAEKKGDKLLECQFQRASELKPDAADITNGDKFAAFFPVARKGDFGFRDGHEFVDPLKIRTFDPSRIFGGMKINIYIDQVDRSGFVTNAAFASQPLMLVLDPAQRTGERYFAAIAPVDKLTMQSMGQIERLGFCTVKAGDNALTEFEALK